MSNLHVRKPIKTRRRTTYRVFVGIADKSRPKAKRKNIEQLGIIPYFDVTTRHGRTFAMDAALEEYNNKYKLPILDLHFVVYHTKIIKRCWN